MGRNSEGKETQAGTFHSSARSTAMICDCSDFGKILEGSTGHTSACNRLQRKAATEATKPPKQKKPIAKVGKTNTWECSDGERYTQEEINHLRKETYMLITRRPMAFMCEGCGDSAQAFAHIVPQARAKQIGKTELIWEEKNIFKACHRCNVIAENVSSLLILKLKNYQRIKAFMLEHDYERATKLPDFLENEQHAI